MTTAVAVTLLVMVLLPTLGVNTGVGLLIAGAVGIGVSFGFDAVPMRVGSTAWGVLNSPTLAAIPIFILMGELLGASRSPGDLFGWIQHRTKGIKHSASLATIVMGALISSVVGSIGAVTAMVTRNAYRPLVRSSDDPVGSLGLVTSVGALGIMLPPSVLMIIYGAITETSIIALFRAGIVPGLLQVLLFALTAVLVSVARNRSRVGQAVLAQDPELVGAAGPGTRARAASLAAEAHPRSVAEVARPTYAAVDEPRGEEAPASFRAAWQFPAAVAVTVAAITSGTLTPVETASLGVVIAVGMLVLNRELGIQTLVTTTVNAAALTAMFMFMVIGAQLIGIVFAFEGTTYELVDLLADAGLSGGAVLLLAGLVYVLLGTIFDGLSMMLLTVPLLFPVVVGLGYDPVWFGIFLVAMVQLAEISPPVGVNIFVAQQLTGQRLDQVWKAVMPYVVALSLFSILLVLVPGLTEVI